MHTLSIFKRELKSYFTHPIAYAIIIVFLLKSMGLAFTFGRFIRVGDASLEWSFFFWHPWLYMLLVPALGMRLWSNEHRTGTIELLATHPISTWSAIIGKYLAAGFVWLIALALTFPIWLTVNYLGAPDNLTIFSGYLGSFLVCCTFLALTALVSAFTRDQVVCLILSVALCVFMVLCGYDDIIREISKVTSTGITEGIISLGVWDHYQSLLRGSFRLQDAIWFITIIGASLLGTNVILSAKRS